MNEKLCKQIVYERSGGLCERCGRQGHTYHHRIKRGQGGRWEPVNIVFVCGHGTIGCHHWIETHPIAASEEGFHVKPWENPADVPILLHRRLSRRLCCDTSVYDSSHTTVESDPQTRSTEKMTDDWTAVDHHSRQADW